MTRHELDVFLKERGAEHLRPELEPLCPCLPLYMAELMVLQDRLRSVEHESTD